MVERKSKYGPTAAVSPHRAAGYLEHDGDGNRTKSFGVSLGYDHENELTSWNGTQVTCGYDGDGLRAWKQVGASGARTYYLYDGETLLAEFTPTGTLSALNTWGANGLVARWTSPSNTTLYYLYDPLGNVSDRLNASQQVVSSDLYDAYGARQSGTSTDPYGYNGQNGYYTDRQAENDSGLILCTYRYYDPDSGSWLTRDPIGYAGGINLYGYVGGEPVGWADPSGCGNLWKWLYTGDWNASDEVYNDAITAAGDWFYDHSPVRGAYISYGWQSPGDLGFFGNIQAGWTVDDGFGFSANGGGCAGNIFSVGGSYGWSEDNSWQWGGSLGRGAGGAGFNPITGGDMTFTVGTYTPGVGGGFFIDPFRLFSGEYWQLH